MLERQKEYREKYGSELGYGRGIGRIRGSGRWRLRVGVVLADSSIVVLALPDIYRDLDTTVFGVTWVLVSFNLVMALAAVPAAMVARRVGPGRAAAVGLAIFAGAGLACGLSDQLSTLIVARSVQAIGGALAVTAALELLPVAVGSERRASVVWATAGATGAALGPALGGILTQLVSWQSIFLIQVPVALARRGADPRRRPPRDVDPGDRAPRSAARPAGRTSGRTWRWRWSRRRSRRRSSSSSCC